MFNFIERLEGRICFSGAWLDTSFGAGGFATSAPRRDSAPYGDADGHDVLFSGLSGDGAMYVYAGALYGQQALYRIPPGGGEALRIEIPLVRSPSAMAVQANGKVLLLKGGEVTRFGPFGQLDGAFGFHGSSQAGLKGGTDGAVVIQPDGKIVYSTGVDSDLRDAPLLHLRVQIARLNPDGSLDTSFGSGGKVYTDDFRDIDLIDLELGANGAIYGATPFGAIWKFSPSGAVDKSFGDNGVSSFAWKDGSARFVDFDVDSQGRVVVVQNADRGWMGVARLTPSGQVDSTFSSAVADLQPPIPFRAASVSVDSADQIYVAGRSDKRIGVMRLTGAGTLDASYGTNGIVAFQTSRPGVTMESSRAEELTFDASGQPMLAGSYTTTWDLYTGYSNGLVVARLSTSPGSAGGSGIIGGYVFDDANGDYTFGPSESGIAGRRVYIDINKNGSFDAGDRVAVTSSSGAYAFGQLTAGRYVIRHEPAGGWRRTLPVSGAYAVTIQDDQIVSARSFGSTRRSLVSGIIFDDKNADGVRDVGEGGLVGVRIHIDGNSNGKYDPGENFVMTDAAGNYFLSAPAEGTIRLRVDPPTGRSATLAAAGARNVVLSTAASLYGRNCGLRSGPSTGGTDPKPITGGFKGIVFGDGNGNNRWDPGETGVAGRRVYLDVDKDATWDAGEASVLTDAKGGYRFSNLKAGEYQVRQHLAAGETGFNPHAVTVTAGLSPINYAFPFRASNPAQGSISGLVFQDQDGDGAHDSGYPAISGARIYLDANNNATRDPGEYSTTTNARGQYTLGGLASGLHRVRFEENGATGPRSVVAPGTGVHAVAVAGGPMGQVNFALNGRTSMMPPHLRGTTLRLYDQQSSDPSLPQVLWYEITFPEFGNTFSLKSFTDKPHLSGTYSYGIYSFANATLDLHANGKTYSYMLGHGGYQYTQDHAYRAGGWG